MGGQPSLGRVDGPFCACGHEALSDDSVVSLVPPAAERFRPQLVKAQPPRQREDGGKEDRSPTRKARPLSTRTDEQGDTNGEEDDGKEVETPRPRNRMLRGKEDERADGRRDRSRKEDNADESACGRGGEKDGRLEVRLRETKRKNESPRCRDEDEYRENVKHSGDRKAPPDKGDLTESAQGERENGEPDTP